MLDPNTAQQVLARALRSGGDFAEIYLEDAQYNTLTLNTGKLQSAVTDRGHGAGIRIFKGLRYVYVYTNDTRPAGLLAAAEQAAAALGSPGDEPGGIRLAWRDTPNAHRITSYPGDVDSARKAAVVRQAYAAASAYDTLIQQVDVRYMDWSKRIWIANSTGLFTADERTYTRLSAQAVAQDGSQMQTGFSGPGGQMGFEIFQSKVDPAAVGEHAARQAMIMLRADECPAGRMQVAIGNGFGGVIFHEACGHSLEASSVAKGNSEFAGKLGQVVASEVVTAVDDGTIPNGWGSGNVDDEGTPTRRNVLIEKGVLKSYLVDIYNGRRMQMPSTGSGRRQSYRYAPTSRMSNTMILPGQNTPEQVIASMSEGLYCAYMGGGSVNPATGDFNFAVSEGYLVKNGQIDRPVRGATLIGRGADVIRKIDMVSADLQTSQGICGSASGSIPADVGQPTIRVSEMTVGGRKED